MAPRLRRLTTRQCSECRLSCIFLFEFLHFELLTFVVVVIIHKKIPNSHLHFARCSFADLIVVFWVRVAIVLETSLLKRISLLGTLLSLRSPDPDRVLDLGFASCAVQTTH